MVRHESDAAGGRPPLPDSAAGGGVQKGLVGVAVHFGAGAIGRGFLGQLYSDSGWETVFVDISPELVRALNERGGYTVEIVGPGARPIRVSRCRAVDGRDVRAVAEELARADLVSTAVGAPALQAVARALAEGVSLRAERMPDSTLDVLICENLLHAARHLRSLLEPLVSPRARAYLAERVGLVETVVSRMIPAPTARRDCGADPLRVAAEDYNMLPADRAAFRGEPPAIRGLVPVDDFPAHEERKLYAHNCGHALAAYLGALEGHEFIWQVIEDERLLRQIERGLWEVGEALCRRHGFAREEHSGHISQLLRRFGNKALGDTIARVGRDPLRKLGPTDRLVGAARLALEFGTRPVVLARGIAAAMRFPDTLAARGSLAADPSAGALAEMMRSGGPERVLREVCKVEPGDELWELVLGALGRLGGGDKSGAGKAACAPQEPGVK